MARSETSTGWIRREALASSIRRLRMIPPQLLSAALVVALAASMVVVALTTSGSSPDPSPQRSAASVDGVIIPMSEVSAALRGFEASGQLDQLVAEADAATAHLQFERTYLAQQITLAVLRSHARELGIDVDEEVTRRIEELRAGYRSEEEFLRTLESSGYTIQRFAALIEYQILGERLKEEVTADVAAGPGPSEAEVRGYYREHREDFRQTEVQHILVQERSIARTLSTRLRNAPVGTVESLVTRLAREHSSDTSSGERGGDLGWVSARQLVEPFASAMDELDVGEVSLPVSTDFGFHVIRVTGRRVLSFERARDDISQRLTGLAVAQAWSGWLLDGYEQAHIELDARYGVFDLSTGQIVDPPSAGSSG